MYLCPRIGGSPSSFFLWKSTLEIGVVQTTLITKVSRSFENLIAQLLHPSKNLDGSKIDES